jgi:hypothetical protein
MAYYVWLGSDMCRLVWLIKDIGKKFRKIKWTPTRKVLSINKKKHSEEELIKS